MSEDIKQIRVLAVDDHPLLREGIAGLIADERDMILVAEAANGREAIQQFRAHHPDVTLMDLQMPEMNGIDALLAIRGEFPDARVIVLTTYTGDVQARRALQDLNSAIAKAARSVVLLPGTAWLARNPRCFHWRDNVRDNSRWLVRGFGLAPYSPAVFPDHDRPDLIQY